MFGKKNKKEDKKPEVKVEKKEQPKTVTKAPPAPKPVELTTAPIVATEPLRTKKPVGVPDLRAGDMVTHKGKRGKVWEINGDRVLLCMEDGSEYMITNDDLDNLARA